MGSRNQIKENLKLQTGLYLYKTGQSKYWYVRILIPKTKKRVSRSTEETSRIEAKKVAYEIYQDFMTKPVKYTKIDAPNSFKIFADKLIKKQTGMVRAGERSIRYVKDDLKILERENRIKLYEDCLKFLKTRVDLDLALFKDDIWSH